ncbi:unnamed protein product [Cylicostephanus goldi]|uniref:Uncharacterized protein n=1 Tax=Cylicostephanus goldi TaxID=71465 RepID=A0A3P6QM88_CYLGO|nr:unnamed protein product [Cylicostephanus goldi]
MTNTEVDEVDQADQMNNGFAIGQFAKLTNNEADQVWRLPYWSVNSGTIPAHGSNCTAVLELFPDLRISMKACGVLAHRF